MICDCYCPRPKQLQPMMMMMMMLMMMMMPMMMIMMMMMTVMMMHGGGDNDDDRDDDDNDDDNNDDDNNDDYNNGDDDDTCILYFQLVRRTRLSPGRPSVQTVRSTARRPARRAHEPTVGVKPGSLAPPGKPAQVRTNMLHSPQANLHR